MTIVDILEMCSEHSCSFGNIQEDLNYNKTTLSGVLKTLYDTRRLRRIQFGMYQITEIGEEYLEEKYSQILNEQTRRITLAAINILDNRGMNDLIPMWTSNGKIFPKQDASKVSDLKDLLLPVYGMSTVGEFGKFLNKQIFHFVLNYHVLAPEKTNQLTWLSFKAKKLPRSMHSILDHEVDGFSDLERIEKICNRKISKEYLFNIFRFFSLPTSARRIYLRNKSDILKEIGIMNDD